MTRPTRSPTKTISRRSWKRNAGLFVGALALGAGMHVAKVRGAQSAQRDREQYTTLSVYTRAQREAGQPFNQRKFDEFIDDLVQVRKDIAEYSRTHTGSVRVVNGGRQTRGADAEFVLENDTTRDPEDVKRILDMLFREGGAPARINAATAQLLYAQPERFAERLSIIEKNLPKDELEQVKALTWEHHQARAQYLASRQKTSGRINLEALRWSIPTLLGSALVLEYATRLWAAYRARANKRKK